MEKLKKFFGKVGNFFKSTFLKVKGWALANKVAAIAIAAGSVVAITLAIVLPVSISAAKRNKEEPVVEHVHTFEEGWSTSTTSHWHAPTCGHDVKGSEGKHEFGDWTITDNKHEHTCSVCGYKVSADHEWGEWHISASSNKIDERECSVCGKVESRKHEHNYVVDKFVWQAMTHGYHADALYSCSLTDDIHVNAVVTPTEVERVDATDTADGHVKYYVEYTTPSGNKATEDKEFVLHRPDEHGFCLNCGEYAGETFSCEKAGSFSLYLGCPLAGDKLYFRCDLLSGHSLYLSDSDYALATELTAYVKNGDVFSPAVLDEEATINTGEDGYVYIVFEASFDRTQDDFLSFTRDHTETSFGLCLSDYVYSGKTYEVGAPFEIDTTTVANKKHTYFRFPIEKNHHYYIQLEGSETDQLDYDLAHPGQSGQAFLAVNHAKHEVPYAEDAVIDEDNGYEPELIEIGEEIGDGYLYWRLSTDNDAGMTLHATIKDDHFEYYELETCAGEIYTASLDEEIVLGEDNGAGHRVMSTDDIKLFRIKTGIAPDHIYYINANGFTPEIVNLYFWNRTTARLEPFQNSWRDGTHKEYFEAPSAHYSHGTVYIEVSPTEALTDASIEINFESHPLGLPCLDHDHGVCSYLFDEYPFDTLTLNNPASSFDLDTDTYFRIAKEHFRNKTFIHVFCTELNLYSASGAQVFGYYKEVGTGTWKKLGDYSSNNNDNWFIHFDTTEKMNTAIDSSEGDYFYLKVHNLGSLVSNITSFTVNDNVL